MWLPTCVHPLNYCSANWCAHMLRAYGSISVHLFSWVVDCIHVLVYHRLVYGLGNNLLDHHHDLIYNVLVDYNSDYSCENKVVFVG